MHSLRGPHYAAAVEGLSYQVSGSAPGDHLMCVRKRTSHFPLSLVIVHLVESDVSMPVPAAASSTRWALPRRRQALDHCRTASHSACAQKLSAAQQPDMRALDKPSRQKVSASSAVRSCCSWRRGRRCSGGTRALPATCRACRRSCAPTTGPSIRCGSAASASRFERDCQRTAGCRSRGWRMQGAGAGATNTVMHRACMQLAPS